MSNGRGSVRTLAKTMGEGVRLAEGKGGIQWCDEDEGR